MSRGPGKIERVIIAALDAEPDNAFTVEDLCARVYEVNRHLGPSKAQRVAVLRAVKNVVKRRDTLWTFAGETVGSPSVYYNAENVLSYAMARLKADSHYQCRDARIASHLLKTEVDLRKQLADDEHHKLIAKGGAWWRHTQNHIAIIKATRSGDQARLDKVHAKIAKQDRLVMSTLAAELR